MSSNVYYDNIQKFLFQYADLVNHSNSLGLTDKALHAENLFAEILNQVFGWKLHNANENLKNQDTFDLADENKRICIQVTSDKNFKRKYTHSVKSFKTADYKAYDHFIILFIANKIKTKLPPRYTENGVTFEYYDLSALLDKVYYKLTTPAKLKKLNLLLQDTISPVLLAGQPGAGLIVHVPSQHLPAVKAGLYIDRSRLVKQLFDFSQVDNGLVVGGPGCGKSFTLEELHRYYNNQKLDCVLIRINELTEGTDEEINLELKAKGNWLEALQKRKGPPTGKHLLVFDAYDTAKDERLKANILKQIRRSITELQSNWHVLVSVRTYDATKSRSLQELFPHGSLVRSVQCRYLEIGELTEEEFNHALALSEYIARIAAHCTPALRLLLRTPYFLKLFEQLITDQHLHNGQLFSGIETEEQLLAIYWKHKVEDDLQKEHFAQKLATRLAEKEGLVCLKTELIESTNLQAYEQLISQGIIAEAAINGKKIGFTHNILLDFAIARYLLEDDLSAQVALIRAHEKIPFIFRQSFMYFYTRLYKTANTLFWQHYSGLAAIDQPIFRLLHQTSLNHVLVQFYNNYRELLPVFQEKDPDKRGHAVRKLLESIRFITKGELRPKDLELLHYVSTHLHWITLWETGHLLEKAIGRYYMEPADQNSRLLSDASCNYLDFMLTERQTFPYPYLVDQNGGSRGIDNFCKTFSGNIDRGKKLLGRLLAVLNEEDFPINFFLYLANHTETIYTADPETGALVYQTLYQQNETSDKVTSMGNSVIMNLRSNRKQDYSMVYYQLEKIYPELLAKSFLPAMRAGVKIVNAYTAFEMRGYRSRVTHPLTIGKLPARLAADFSFFESEKERGPFSHVDPIFAALAAAPGFARQDPNTNQNLKELISLIEAGKLWRKLIQLIGRNLPAYTQVAFEILKNKAFYIVDETLYDAGGLLRLLWPHLDYPEKEALENVVHTLANEQELIERGIAERRISRVLNCVPAGQLTLKISRNFIAAEEPVSNSPTVSPAPLVSVSRGYTREEQLIRSGFDPQKETDVKAYSPIEQLETFNNYYQDHADEKLTAAKYQPLLPVAEHLFGESKGWTVVQRVTAEHELCRFARILSSLGKKLPAKEKAMISQFTLEFSRSEHYNDKEYQAGTLRTHGTSFGPNAKTTAVQTLINLLCDTHSKEMSDTLIGLLGDNTQIIRFKAAKGLTYFWKKDKPLFWKTLKDRIAKETDGMAFGELLRAVTYDDIIKSNQEEIKTCATVIMERLKTADDEIAADLWRAFSVLLLKMILRYDSTFARQLITANLEVKELSRSLIFELMTVIDPHETDNDYSTEPHRYDNLISLVTEILEYRFAEVRRKGINTTDSHPDLEIIDYIIQHLFFITETGRADNKGNILSQANKSAFYHKIRPILDLTVEHSAEIGSGFMVAHTGYYFMQILNFLLDADPAHILDLSNSIVLYAATNGFTYDQSTLKEVIELTEHIIADHKDILYQHDNFSHLVTILDQFAGSGWQEALELTWRLKDAF